MGFFDKLRRASKPNRTNLPKEKSCEDYKEVYVSKSLQENRKLLEDILDTSDDIIYRQMDLNNGEDTVLLVCVDSMVKREIISNEIINPIRNNEIINKKKELTINGIAEKLLTAMDVKFSKTFNKLVLSLLSGDTILFLNSYDEAIIVETKGWEKRSIDKPTSEETVNGSREGFVESIGTNISLIRRRIRNPKLSVETLLAGERTKTKIGILYLSDIANKEFVQEAKDRINKIDTDGFVGSTKVEQLIESHKWTIFPQILSTERVDKAAANILEGRFIIIVDGTPFVLIAPVTFAVFLNSPDDYYERTITSSFMRVIRYISYFLTTTLPALYLALTTYHPGMIPTPLVLTITKSRIGLPFPTVIEVVLMEFILEILTEASLRLPKSIGQAISIVGGLVIGQAAVQAGIVSPLIIIVVALTALTSFVIPVYSFTLSNRLIRFPLIFFAALWGLYGIFMGWIFILIHLASLESFGVRYLADFSPYNPQNIKDTFVNVHQSLMTKRPEILKVQDIKRQRINKG